MKSMMFGGLVLVVYAGLAYARRYGGGCNGECILSGLEFAYVACLEVAFAALIVFVGTILYQEPNRSSERRLVPVDRECHRYDAQLERQSQEPTHGATD